MLKLGAPTLKAGTSLFAQKTFPQHWSNSGQMAEAINSSKRSHCKLNL